MKREEFKSLVKQKVLILDGAMGTQMQQKGMPAGVCAEDWAAKNTDIIVDIHNSYIDSGSNIIYSCTFGGSRVKLDEYGLGDKVFQINGELVKAAKKAAGKNVLVAGDIGPTGLLIEPFGETDFEKIIDVFKEQAEVLINAGADLIVIETMMDLQEARAALIAVREISDIPVIVSMTFDQHQRTLSGTDPVTAVIALQSLGADAVGCNCSTGPEDMIKVIRMMKPFAKVPLVAKPNAGMPKMIDGKTVFEMPPEDFVKYTAILVEEGASLVGGCCGTSPEYIKKLCNNVKSKNNSNIINNDKNNNNNIKIESNNDENNNRNNNTGFSALTSARKAVFIGGENPLAVIGERINPTGKKQLAQELREGKMSEVRRFAAEQIERGAVILDVNVGVGGIDEQETMRKVVKTLSVMVDAPLCIDSSSTKVIETALRIYPGKALVNSVSGETEKIKELMPIVAKYGAMFILLPIDDQGVPLDAKKRIDIIKKVYSEAQKYGICKDDIIIDGLVMTVSSNQESAKETLDVISWSSKNGLNSVFGLSNISFGLPQRKYVNIAFFAMAASRGLTAVIANPSQELFMEIKMSLDVLLSNDKKCVRYIQYFSQESIEQTQNIEEGKNKKIYNLNSLDKNKGKNNEENSDKNVVDELYKAVLDGNSDNIDVLIDVALRNGYEAKSVVDKYLIPAIDKVGELYDKKKYFLPQLIQSAETMKKAFQILEPHLKIAEGENIKKREVIVMATVKGDIHDIGKNIVCLMLRNSGFEVIDLGKDVPKEVIINTAKENNASIIGLSALMTTTMLEMKNVIEYAKQKDLRSKIIVGGAAVDQAFANQIGADGYAVDAYEAVKLVNDLLHK